MKLFARCISALLMSAMMMCQMMMSPLLAFADTASTGQSQAATVSSEGDAAIVEGCSFGMNEFSRAQKGSNSGILNSDGETETYFGYRYYVSATAGSVVVVGMTG